MHDAEPATDDARAAEDAVHLFRRGIGGNVEILGGALEQEIADGTTHDESGKACFVQFLCGF